MKFPSLSARLRHALVEDGAWQDITTRQISPKKPLFVHARILSKDQGIFCGGSLIKTVFKLLDLNVKVTLLVKDRAKIRHGQVIAKIGGSGPAVLAGERLILNLISHVSGIATLTHKYVEAVKGTKARILDTRKTTPLWRDLEKYAVVCGGGVNHRFSLKDGILVKDNHHRLLEIKKCNLIDVFATSNLSKMRRKIKFIAIEASNLSEVWGAIKAQSEIILLDNMPPNQIKGALMLIKATRKAFNTRYPLVEVSGGVSLKKAKILARMGVDRISVGALTHSAPALDMSLEVE